MTPKRPETFAFLATLAAVGGMPPQMPSREWGSPRRSTLSKQERAERKAKNKRAKKARRQGR